MAGTGYGRRRAGLALAGAATAVTVLLSGCGANGDSRSSSDTAAAPQAQTQKMAEGAAPAAGAPATAGDAKSGAAAASAAPAGATEAPVAPRLIAYTAQLTLRSKEVARTLAEARDLATAAGGYVAGEQLGGKGGDGATTDARLTLKVPSATYQQSLDRLAGMGEVLSRSSQADDLTEQVADVESRLKTQQASVDRVRKLMAEAKTLTEVVSLESELSRREAELESLQQRRQGLTARTSLSTITLQVFAGSGPAPKAAERKDGFWASVGGALSGGWHVLVAVVRGLLMAVAAVAPFLLVLGPVGALLWWLRRRTRTTAVPTAPVVPERPEHDPAE
ncbi:DUF4349 domain-containing protein [Kitasatospora sp. NBC_00070]|uniref:DUF4349 domain-containing protein n=1 Tax=Kitasatospora sp. NBC_00070 TaxID=2975962 RepID=UPI0032511EF8